MTTATGATDATRSGRWLSSSYSQEGQCVELNVTWRRARASSGAAGSNCVELATYRSAAASGTISCVQLAVCGCDEPRVGVRDSKQPDGAQLDLPDAARGALLSFVRLTNESVG